MNKNGNKNVRKRGKRNVIKTREILILEALAKTYRPAQNPAVFPAANNCRQRHKHIDKTRCAAN
jgi:hypothetical protein